MTKMTHQREAIMASADCRKASYDTIGKIPRIGARTSTTIPGNMEAYVAQSTAEVRT